MFWTKKSFTDNDVLEVAMEIRMLDQKTEEETPLIAGGMLEWAKKNPSNQSKVHKAMGIVHGIVAGSYRGKASDFDKFFRLIIIKAFNYGFGMNFGKTMYRDHMRLRKKMDKDYFSGIKEGKEQVNTGENFYLKNRLTW